MASLTIKITNAAQIQKAFAQAPAKMTKALTKAIKQSVFLLQGRSMSNTPVLTGRLRGSHYTRFMPLKGEVGANANYAGFVHDGTRFMKGRPFLEMALSESNEEIQDFFTRGTQDVLNEIGRDA